MLHITGHRKINKSFRLTLCMVMLCCMLTGCGASKEQNNGPIQNLNPEKVISLLGKEKQEVLKLFETVIADAASETDEIALNESMKYKDAAAEIKLIFENDVLFRVQYDFKEKNDLAFEFKDGLYKQLKETYGDPDTYPTMPDRIEGLSLETYMSDEQFQYKEYWIDANEDLNKAVPENI